MAILVLNTGSSSHKCVLFDREGKELWHAKVSHPEGIEQLLQDLPDVTLTAIAHRVVHGGTLYTVPVEITEEVIENLYEISSLAPLHQLPNLKGIEIMKQKFPHVRQYAFFDTAFHATLDEKAYVYPLPYPLLKQGVRRYGFHGISFSYCSKRGAELLKRDLKSLKMVICHLGSGASLCAIKEGKSIDTTMGMTPLEGLMMATRSGSIDPAIVFFLMRKHHLSLDAMEQLLNIDSGFLGVSEISDDIRIVMESAARNNEKAKLAVQIFLHRLKGFIGMMVAVLEGLDVLIFTGGIGEHIASVRQDACDAFQFLGLKIDAQKNASAQFVEGEFSLPESTIKALLIPTHEEQEIVRQLLLLR